MSKYQRIYNQIINRAVCDNRVKGNGVYYENHHIIPKSMAPNLDKDPNNLVLLTAKEHFICHYLLTKFCRGNNKTKMLRAFHLMSFSPTGNRRCFSSILYEENKIKLARALRKPAIIVDYRQKLPLERQVDFKNGIIESHGPVNAFITKNKISNNKPCQAGHNNPMYGKNHKESTKLIIKNKAIMRTTKNPPKGTKNANAKTVVIYDSLGNLKYLSTGNFNQLCASFGLPGPQLMVSYKNGGSRIYQNKNYHNLLVKNKKASFIGWYATLL